MGFIIGRRPTILREKILDLLKSKNVDVRKYPCSIIGLRGYYPNAGRTPNNERGIYDDAFTFLSPSVFATFNGNTDPHGYRYGYGTGRKKGMASLKEGVWLYQRGLHKKQYGGLIQYEAVTVQRDGRDGDYLDQGWFGINFHRGGIRTTGSFGCQTLPPNQWTSFKNLVYAELHRFDQRVVPYVLVDAETEGIVGHDRPTLRLGDQGQEVRALQFILKDIALRVKPDVKADGDFGLVTRNHVVEFQALKLLKVDGEVGPKTWAALLDFTPGGDLKPLA